MANQVDYAFLADLNDDAVLAAFERIDARAKATKSTLSSTFTDIQKNGTKSFKALESAAKNAIQSINSEMATIAQSANLTLPGTERQVQLATEQAEVNLQKAKIQLQREELSLVNQITAAKARSKIAAEQALQSEIARYPQLNQQLQALVAKYGQFNVVLGRNQAELNKEEKEVIDLINKYPQLAGKIDTLTKEYGELNLQLKKTDTSNANAGKSAVGFAARLGGIVSVSYLVTSALRNMARTGVDALKELINTSITTAQQFDLVRISLQGILGTEDTGRVERLFTSIRASSRDLGTNVADIANAFLPLLDNIGQLERAGEAVSELIQLSIVGGKQQTQGDAIRAIAEGFSGDFISIRRLFELTPGEIDKIRDTYRELGTEGFLDALDEVLTARGISLDKFRGTTQFVFSQIQEYARDFQDQLGTPIDEALFEFLDGLKTFIDANFDDILALGEAVGNLIATLVTDTGDTILEDLNDVDFDNIFDDLKELNETIETTKIAFENVGKVIKPVLNLFKTLTQPGLKLAEIFGIEQDFASRAERFNDLIETGNELIRNLRANLAQYGAAISTATQLTDDLVKGRITFKEFADQIEVASEIAKATVFDEYARGIDNATESVEEFNTAIDESREGQGGGQTEGDIARFAIEQLPQQLKAQDDIIAENQAKIAERTAKIDTEIYRKRLDMRKDFIEKELDLEIDFAREREDIEIGILRDIEDAYDDVLKDRRDARIDHQRDLEDINVKYDQKLFETEKESAQKRIDIEKELQEELKQIRREFLFDAEEAVRNNDAVAFLRIQRKYQFEVQEAKEKARQEREDAVGEEKQKRAEIEVERQEQIRQAQIDRDRDFADLTRKLADEIAEIAKARDRELADQRLREERRLEDLALYRQREKEEFDQFQKEKLEDLAVANADEVAVIAQAQADKLKIEANGYQNLLRLQAEYLKARVAQDKKAQQFLGTSGYGQIPADEEEDATPTEDLGKKAQAIGDNILELAAEKDKLTTELVNQVATLIANQSINKLLELYGNMKKLADGGSVRANESVIVGDGGAPEIFTPDRAGTVTPLSDLGGLLDSYVNKTNGFSLPTPGASSVDNSKNYNVDLSMLDPNHLSPGQIAMVVEVVKQVLFAAT